MAMLDYRQLELNFKLHEAIWTQDTVGVRAAILAGANVHEQLAVFGKVAERVGGITRNSVGDDYARCAPMTLALVTMPMPPDNENCSPFDYRFTVAANVVAHLLDGGASPNTLDGGRSPLHRAVVMANCPMALLLRRRGAFIREPDIDGKTVLDVLQAGLSDTDIPQPKRLRLGIIARHLCP